MLRDIELLVALEQLDVCFLAGSKEVDTVALPEPLLGNLLLQGLICSKEARIRLALIPLFLQHAHFVDFMSEALRGLKPVQQGNLFCYYTAAQLLQQKYNIQLIELFGTSSPLPELFEKTLGLEQTSAPDDQLHHLAERHADISNKPINWYGTYEYAYERLVRFREKRLLWQL